MANGPFTRRRLIQDIEAVRDGMLPGGPKTTGKVYYVSSGTGSDSYDGLSKTYPKATLAAAISVATAAKSDVIMVMPGHTESITGAAGITINKSGLRITGVGNGRNRPVFTFSTSTAAQIVISSADVMVENCVFDLTGIDAITAGFAVDAADVGFVDCEFLTNSATAGVVSAITVGASTTSPRFYVRNCRFIGPATNSGTTTTAQITITDAPDFVIKDSYFTGKMTQAITNGAAVLRGSIDNNRFVVATGTKAINMHASSTPFISNNRINVPSGTAPIVAAAGFVCGNNYSAAAGVTAGTAATL